ncbi:MAG: MaoC family dehydratase [Pseudomonadota bacterium]|nr:MaoC family dehydratase [Pseudomonadota bacterium]MEE2859675.1 MaoC family dehydratase [Pseudomonadota bacterium]
MLKLQKPQDLLDHIGEELGTSGWQRIDQRELDLFSEATRHVTWLHNDPERCKTESPTGTTLVQGFLTLGMLTGVLHEVLDIAEAGRWINYGLDRIRFPAALPVGGEVRTHFKLIEAEPAAGGGVKFRLACTTEIKGADKPAMSAEFLSIVYE